MGMLKLNVLETFIFWNMTIADDLDFGLVGNSLEVWMEDAAFGIEGFAVTVAMGIGIKAVGEFKLCFGRASSLVLEDDYLGFVEGVTNEGEVIICKEVVSCRMLRVDQVALTYVRRLPFHGVLPLFIPILRIIFAKLTYLSGSRHQCCRWWLQSPNPKSGQRLEQSRKQIQGGWTLRRYLIVVFGRSTNSSIGLMLDGFLLRVIAIAVEGMRKVARGP